MPILMVVVNRSDEGHGCAVYGRAPSWWRFARKNGTGPGHQGYLVDGLRYLSSLCAYDGRHGQ